ncbi:TonB-dependent receptor [Caulobacter vibrioides]|uniref:TonB-dependent receptor n=1 Tax=Caulobacter vibrioides TaxID=155892 RepID=UPI000BB4BD34|nr:TonB-dependent receptor [Caulobacter vibrioides]ATC26710.1 TonB-dependent receptor [Caulobacter vibrioides]AZH12322.1 TonB-dependent receptor [Caulobacter vibrioides]PLR08514.1 TonB-dependent receptor [Caulobacter vibrioides]
MTAKTWTWLGSASALAMMLAGAPALAAPAAKPTLAIPAGDLATALPYFSRATGLQVLADPALLKGKRTEGVRGQFEAERGLTELLRGTGLNFVRNGGAAILRPMAQRVSTAPAPVAAQAAPVAPTAAQAEEPATLEAVVVTGGFANSLARALADKRKAANVVDAISAEDIGKFPSNNIAEALQRVPGVAITRDRGEGLFVRVRGLGPNFQIVTLNGRSAAVNENMRDSGQSGRQFRFDTLPSELVAGVEVGKSPLASLDEGALGGVVDVKTFRPLDLGRSTLALSATASRPQLAGKTDPRLSGLASWTNAEGTFGVLAALVFDQRTLRQDRITGVGWSYADPASTLGKTMIAQGISLYPTAIRPTLEREDRERKGVVLSAQYRPSDETEITVDASYTKLDDHYDELTYSVDQNVATLAAGSAVIKDGVLVGGTVNSTTQIGREVSDLAHDNLMVAGRIRQKLEDWTLTADLAYARAFSETSNPITRTRLLGPIGQTTFSMTKVDDDAVPSVRLATADLGNPSLLPFRRIEWRENNATDDETALQFDAERPLSWGLLSRVQFGVKYRERSRDYNRADINYTTNLAGKFFGAEYFDAFPVSSFLGKVDGTLPTNWAMPDPAAFWGLADKTQRGTARADKRNSYQVSEDIAAGYILGDVESKVFNAPLRGQLGVRVARTEQISAGHADNGSAAIPVRYKETYTDVLPTANFALELTDTLQARFAAAKVITRPSLADLAPRLTLNSSGTVLTAVGGNPLLKPFEAWQYDATLEWYFAPGSALIAGAFYKDITTFVYSQKTNIVVDGQTYLLTSPTNGGSAKIKGIELAYQHLFKRLPAPFDGLGFLANYTYTDTEATYSPTLKDEMVNVAKNSFNLTAFYEKDRFAARASYSWVDDVLQDVGGAGLSALNDSAFGSLDASVSYKITPSITAAVEAQNLTNASQWQFVKGGWFGGYTHYGRTLSFGLRAKF